MPQFDIQQVRTELFDFLGRRVAPLGSVLTLEDWQQNVRDSGAVLGTDEMLQVVDTAARLFEDLYVHLDLKRKKREIDPVADLADLRETIAGGGIATTPSFHRRMFEIFKTFADVHTAYRPPPPYRTSVAFLPFLLARVGDPENPEYVVSNSLFDQDERFAHIPLRSGTRITRWGGLDVDEAVKRAAESEEGSNDPNDLALGRRAMTVRWLGASFEPDSSEVLVGYNTPDGIEGEIAVPWFVLHITEGPEFLVSLQAIDAVFGRPRSNGDTDRTMDVGGDVVHSIRLALYAPQKRVELERWKRQTDTIRDLGNRLRSLFYGYVDRGRLNEFTQAELTPEPGDGRVDLPSLLPVFLEAAIFEGDELITRGRRGGDDDLAALHERRIGYIRIRAFPLLGVEADYFKYELRRLLNEMPSDGLILDIRDNPGGSAGNAEGSLQFITAKEITPIPFRFTATELTRSIARREFQPYQPSIEACLAAGERFSAGRPITPRKHANELGQHYFGPVVLLTSALSYSAADIFAAGFRDNGIGDILAVDETTGGGGANTWFYQPSVRRASGTGSPLPGEINMQIAVRQCLRIGTDVLGVPIEEVGVQSKGSPHPLAIEDVLARRPPWTLLLKAASMLADKPSYDLETSLSEYDDSYVVSVRTKGIARLDFYVNGLPYSVPVRSRGAAADSPRLPKSGKVELEIRGYAEASPRPELVARYIQVFPA